MLKQLHIILLIAVAMLCLATNGGAMDLTQGVMLAVPTPDGKAPTIDGNLADWDLSATEPTWLAPEVAHLYQAQAAMMYDTDALYFSVQASLPNRALKNANSPIDAFWWGDLVQLRLVTDPTLPYPAGGQAFEASNQVLHISFWKNTETGNDYIHVNSGANFDKGQVVNPAGSKVVVKTGRNEFIIEARLPWSVLNVPGGKNPFKPGQRMTGIFEVIWGNNTNRVAAVYREHPNVFAFNRPGTWGQFEFSPTGHIAPRHETMEAALAKYAPKPVGVPITIDVPEKMKVSVNIFGPNGEVIRELIGGELCPQGKKTVYWDGRDQWGNQVQPGDYTWGAFLSYGLRAQYMGSVGTSGNPPYSTVDDKGGWGGDHGDPIDVAADDTGLYFVWVGAEAGRAVVKTDYQGNVIWRKSPFIGGGMGPYYAMATNGKYLYLAHGDTKTALAKLDAATGRLLAFEAATLAPISDSEPIKDTGTLPDVEKLADAVSPVGTVETVGLAATATEVYASAYTHNRIRVFNAETGALQRELPCPGPRGLALDVQGNLYAVSFVPGKTAQVVKFAAGNGTPQVIVSTRLIAPWDVAVDAKQRLHVTDGASSQQVKVFDAAGKFLRAIGKQGGRPWAGKYDAKALLNPTGIAADRQGGILVAETSIPKVMSRFSASNGKLLQRWFGYTAYSASNIPDPDDPWTNYYSVSYVGFARARIPKAGGLGYPDAYWQMPKAGYPHMGTVLDTMAVPDVIIAKNGKKYLVSDANPHGICLVEGDKMIPVGYARTTRWQDEKPGIEVWSDVNGDQQPQLGELTMLNTIDGKEIVRAAEQTGSMWMAPNGDLYLLTGANKIIKIPAIGFDRRGVIHWDVAKASYAVPEVLANPGPNFGSGWRSGLLGVRTDTKGNIYTCFNAPHKEYATPELTEKMKNGIGWTSGCTAVKFAKYTPDGKLLWMAGRKATGPALDGEIYHFWVIGGLLNDRYITGCSEWGQMYFYTDDGFYVDAIMNNPGFTTEPGPYTFGGETFAGRVQYFPKQDQVWAYSCNFAYQVEGFKHGKVEGERRMRGTVRLDKVYDVAATTEKVEPLQLVSLTNPLADAKAWDAAPVNTLHRAGKPLATAQLGYDADNIYARVHVVDDSPLQNSADDLRMAFKWGDCVGLDLGMAGKRDTPQAGDVRLLASMIGGQPRLIAMKPFTKLAKSPNTYASPVGGAPFEFVGEVPGGKVTLTPDADGQGYTALIAVPRAFLEFTIQPGTPLAGDVEVLLSGQAARGLQTVSRNFLFTPPTPQTSMIDDIPTEARLYPQYWGTAEVK